MNDGYNKEPSKSNVRSLTAKRQRIADMRHELIKAAGILLRAMEQLGPTEDEHPVRAAVRKSLGDHLSVIKSAVHNMDKGKRK